jgi:methyl acetate hydrolase
VFVGAAGLARVAQGLPMAPDSVFQIYSMTKPLTCLATVQLIEQGALHLDDPVEWLLPELSELKVLQKDGSLRPARHAITLRHLLTHTSGLGYAFTSRRLALFQRQHPDDPAPLLFDPGQAWHYGTSTDWLGRLVASISGVSLDAYFEEHILGPLGMVDTTYVPSAQLTSRHVTEHRRQADGTLGEVPFTPQSSQVSGGGGLASTVLDYARFLSWLLGDGAAHSLRLLSRDSMTAFTADQTGEIVAGHWHSGLPAYSNDLDMSDDGTARWSWMGLWSARDMPGKRSAGSVSWGGLANTYFWADRSAGIGGVLLMQVLPFADRHCLDLFDVFERTAYHLYT